MKPNKTLRLAIQKSGRLTEETVAFLKSSGLEFDAYNTRLFSSCKNFNVDILYVRDDDIPGFVQTGAVDLGIVGTNVLFENNADVVSLLPLGYAKCRLILAVPSDSAINTIEQLDGKTITTSYPNTVKNYLAERKIVARIVPISGAVEITPALGLADAIIDITATGSTLALNDLVALETIRTSEAMLIARKNLSDEAKEITDSLLIRFTGVLAAKSYKYIMLNAPETIIDTIGSIVPGLKSPTIAPLRTPGWVSMQTVIKEDIFWETIEKLKAAGATGIIVMPIEKMII